MSKPRVTKVVDPGLREFLAEGDPGEHRSVIVELASPRKKATTRPTKLPPPKQKPPTPHDLTTLLADEDVAASLDRLEDELAAQDLDEKPVRLNLAEAFVVSVTPPQLQAISQSPLVG